MVRRFFSKRSSSTPKPSPSTSSSTGRSNQRPQPQSNGNSAAASSSNAERPATTTSGPGAHSVGAANNVFRVTIPFNVTPGSDFQVFAGDRLVRVRCPLDSSPGQVLQISLPGGSGGGGGPSVPNPRGGRGAAAAAGGSPENTAGSNGGVPNDRSRRNSEGVEPMPNGGYMVRIPDGVGGGQQFPIMIMGRQLMVSCPPNGSSGMRVQIFPGTDLNESAPQPRRRPQPRAQSTMQQFEVIVPNGVTGGQPFALMAAGQRIVVTCPPNALPGQRIRFPVPMNLLQSTKKTVESRKDVAKRLGVDEVALKFDGGWARTIRVDDGDLKFQWVRQNGEEGAVKKDRFDIKTSAYVRKIDYSSGVKNKYLTGTISLVPATEGLVDSRVTADGNEIIGYADIATAQTKNFDEKVHWFHDTCQDLSVEWNQGHMRMNVRRDYLLSDSVSSVMSLSQKDLRKVWRLEFIGEDGIDAGGLTREWYQLITEELFNPDIGLWTFSATNQMCMQINPASGKTQNQKPKTSYPSLSLYIVYHFCHVLHLILMRKILCVSR